MPQTAAQIQAQCDDCRDRSKGYPDFDSGALCAKCLTPGDIAATRRVEQHDAKKPLTVLAVARKLAMERAEQDPDLIHRVTLMVKAEDRAHRIANADKARDWRTNAKLHSALDLSRRYWTQALKRAGFLGVTRARDRERVVAAVTRTVRIGQNPGASA